MAWYVYEDASVDHTQEIQDFAKEHNLTLKVTCWQHHPPRYTASFEQSETLADGFLTSAYGDGKTITDAIEDYCEKISNTLLIINAANTCRKEIRVPLLEYIEDERV